MSNNILSRIRADAGVAVAELIPAAHLTAGQILVVGCSSSEMVGGASANAPARTPPPP